MDRLGDSLPQPSPCSGSLPPQAAGPVVHPPTAPQITLQHDRAFQQPPGPQQRQFPHLYLPYHQQVQSQQDQLRQQPHGFQMPFATPPGPGAPAQQPTPPAHYHATQAPALLLGQQGLPLSTPAHIAQPPQRQQGPPANLLQPPQQPSQPPHRHDTQPHPQPAPEQVPSQKAQDAGPSAGQRERDNFGLVLPLSRIKKLIKQEGSVKAISAEASYAVTRATEMLVETLAEKSAVHMYEGNRSVMIYKDVATAVKEWPAADFLSDIVPETITVGELRQLLQKQQQQKALAAANGSEPDDGDYQ